MLLWHHPEDRRRLNLTIMGVGNYNIIFIETAASDSAKCGEKRVIRQIILSQYHPYKRVGVLPNVPRAIERSIIFAI